MKKFIGMIVIIIMAGSLVACGTETSVPNRRAGDFSVVDIEGNEVRLSDMEGMPVVVNFWASWCPPCRSEMPDFDMVYSDLGEEVQFMMVNLTDGSRETVEIASRYISDNGFSFPAYFDVNGEAAAAYGVMVIPTSVFIDRDGVVVSSVRGAISEEVLRERIQQIL